VRNKHETNVRNEFNDVKTHFNDTENTVPFHRVISVAPPRTCFVNIDQRKKVRNLGRRRTIGMNWA